MRLASPSLPLLAFVAAAASSCCAAEAAPEPEYIFTNPPAFKSSDYRIPTSYESAVLGRRILALTPLGTLATVFPGSSDDAQFSDQEDRPHGLGGMPLGLMDYVADCEGEGNPTILAIDIATSFKNVRAGSNISLAQHWTPRYPPAKRIKSTAGAMLDWFLGRVDDDDNTEGEGGATTSYSAANLPRFNLLGYLEKIDDDSSQEDLAACFVAAHPDAKYWLPGNRIHASEFVRLVVTQVYWIGGFGDRAYIGWIPVDEWKNVTRAEWERVTLPGEKKGWKEWSAEL
ncbi:pyridoxamine 5'-phosphate oxidase-domain-containing protein [Biscogniauxia mediterranea]|nr:pyridoxamine 5'-phosphate oxidase-domain-containing protein [Biscogniauxia mediterranea]